MTSPSRRILALVGPGEGASLDEIAAAERIAELAARAGWAIACGGRDAGVMAAAARGAARGGGVSLGLLPEDAAEAAPELTVAVGTGLGEARNAVLAASCHAMVACGMNPGTAAEVSFALKAGKPVVLIRPAPATERFFQELAPELVRVADSADQALALLTMSN